MQLTTEQSDLRTALDQMRGGLAFFGADGNVVFANRLMREALEGREADVVVRAITEVKKAAHAVALEDPQEDGVVSDRLVECADRRCWIRGVVFRQARMDGVIRFLISFAELPDFTVSEDEVRAKFGLTPQEARVALLLAEGRSNQEIASELQLSPHTTRNYTRRVLQRLHATNRAQVGWQILHDR